MIMILMTDGCNHCFLPQRSSSRRFWRTSAGSTWTWTSWRLATWTSCRGWSPTPCKWWSRTRGPPGTGPASGRGHGTWAERWLGMKVKGRRWRKGRRKRWRTRLLWSRGAELRTHRQSWKVIKQWATCWCSQWEEKRHRVLTEKPNGRICNV